MSSTFMFVGDVCMSTYLVACVSTCVKHVTLLLSRPEMKQSRAHFPFTDVWISYEMFQTAYSKSARLSFLPGQLRRKRL